jgi:hypothetical protein
VAPIWLTGSYAPPTIHAQLTAAINDPTIEIEVVIALAEDRACDELGL